VLFLNAWYRKIGYCSGIPHEELNGRNFPTKMASSDTLILCMKYQFLTVQILEFLIKSHFLRKVLNRKAPEQLQYLMKSIIALTMSLLLLMFKITEDIYLKF
jgi:hypothetical protein